MSYVRALTLSYSGYGTNIGSSGLVLLSSADLGINCAEGPWSEVSQAIHDCHAAVHAKGALRVATDIRIGTRVDRDIPVGEGNDLKVKRVEGILAAESSNETP